MLNTNDDLYVHEQYKFGSKEKERSEFEDHVRRVLAAQQALAAQHAPGNPQRVFHAKAHACLAGKLTLIEDRPAITRHGIFADNGKRAYNVLARFSSGVGFDQHDLKPDVRGLALKIFGVSDGSTPGEQRKTRTFDGLMTNSTNPFGKDQDEFVRFMEANVNPGLLGINLIGFLLGHADVARLLMKATFKIMPSLATAQYWSGHPYLLGPRLAMKFNVRPLDDAPAEIDNDLQQAMSNHQAGVDAGSDNLGAQVRRWFEMHTVGSAKVNPNYLSVELRNRLQRGPIKFVFAVQLEKDAGATPLENGLTEWKESDSPSIPVAELSLEREIDANLGRALRFTPGNFVADHRPLGNLGRGRIFTYEASQTGRHAAAEEPDERIFFDA